MEFARELWLRIETLHAVTYFGEETQHAGRDLGLSGFWMGYFGFRAAPLGPASAGTVEATFANFAPSFLRRWVPEVWALASPPELVEARAAAAAATLRRLVPDVDAAATAVAPFLDAAIAHGVTTGRPLFAANRDLPLPDDPVAALWQRTTTLREHRGDSHVAALTAVGISGLAAHVLISLDLGTDPADLQRTRGWTADEWAGAVDDLRRRNLVEVDETTGEAVLAPTGRVARTALETTTDIQAGAPWEPLTEVERTRVIELLTPAAVAVSASEVIRYPNPIGLPRLT